MPQHSNFLFQYHEDKYFFFDLLVAETTHCYNVTIM